MENGDGVILKWTTLAIECIEERLFFYCKSHLLSLILHISLTIASGQILKDLCSKIDAYASKIWKLINNSKIFGKVQKFIFLKDGLNFFVSTTACEKGGIVSP